MDICDIALALVILAGVGRSPHLRIAFACNTSVEVTDAATLGLARLGRRCIDRDVVG